MRLLNNLKNALGGKKPVAPADANQHYTVASGDTLWKIASEFYGDGSAYMKIYAANKDILESPEHILPGQELVIPAE